MKDEFKEKSKNFLNKAKNFFDRGFNASKKAIGVAGEAVQDFSDKSVTTIEIKQLESKVKKQYTDLGEYVASVLSKKEKTVSASDEKVSVLLKEISRLNNEIKTRKLSLNSGKNEKSKKKTSSTVSKKTVKATTKTSTKTSNTSKSSDKKATPKTTVAKKANTTTRKKS